MYFDFSMGRELLLEPCKDLERAVEFDAGVEARRRQFLSSRYLESWPMNDINLSAGL